MNCRRLYLMEKQVESYRITRRVMQTDSKIAR